MTSYDVPSNICRYLEVARNPEMMREQMRATDQTMRNIEAHPEAGRCSLTVTGPVLKAPLVLALETML
jgi:hypothetical protein